MEPSEAAALLKEVQATELIMLKEVATFCDARGLRYYLYCGTLLGAVRHGGFIPWDDDVDLAMPYGDYRRFLASREELTGYTVESPETNPYAYTTWIRVYKDGTTFLDPAAVGTPVHKGVFLDIYPIIGARTSRLGRKWQSLCLRGAMSLLASGQFRNRTEMKHPLTRLAARLPEPMTRRMGHLLWKICGRDDTKREYVGTVDRALFAPKYRRADWEKTVRLPFEDAEFTAPAEWDRFLRIMYGDYRTLPPPFMRRNHIERQGDRMIIDMNRDYREVEEQLMQQEGRL